MSKKRPKLVLMTKDMFSLYLTFAFLFGMHASELYVLAVERWG